MKKEYIDPIKMPRKEQIAYAFRNAIRYAEAIESGSANMNTIAPEKSDEERAAYGTIAMLLSPLSELERDVLLDLVTICVAIDGNRAMNVNAVRMALHESKAERAKYFSNIVRTHIAMNNMMYVERATLVGIFLRGPSESLLEHQTVKISKTAKIKKGFDDIRAGKYSENSVKQLKRIASGFLRGLPLGRTLLYAGTLFFPRNNSGLPLHELVLKHLINILKKGNE